MLAHNDDIRHLVKLTLHWRLMITFLLSLPVMCFSGCGAGLSMLLIIALNCSKLMERFITSQRMHVGQLIIIKYV